MLAPTEIITDARLPVRVIDVNNKGPEFEGLDASGKYSSAVSGETELGEEVVKVTAVDLDGTSPNNQVIYKFDDDCGSECEDFLINRETGVITANKPDGFRREDKAHYTLSVIAEDGAPSAIRSDGEPNRSEHCLCSILEVATWTSSAVCIAFKFLKSVCSVILCIFRPTGSEYTGDWLNE